MRCLVALLKYLNGATDGQKHTCSQAYCFVAISANLYIFEAKVSARGLECTCSEAHGASLLSGIIFVATLCEFAYFMKPIGPQRAGA